VAAVSEHVTVKTEPPKSDLELPSTKCRTRGLRSIMPRATTGSTMGPCVIIGERAAEILHPGRAHALTSHKKG